MRIITAALLTISFHRATASFAISNNILPHTISSKRSFCVSSQLPSSFYNDDDDDEYSDFNEENVSEKLTDWRNFRSSLLANGLTTLEEENENDEDGDGAIAMKENEEKKVKSVSKMNENLLASQNPELAEEYMNGVWCHKVGRAEVGGLVLRTPLEYEVYFHKTGKLGQKLKERLKLSSSSGSSNASDDNNEDIIDVDNDFGPAALDTSSSSADSFASAAKTAYWYKAAKEMIDSDMKNIMNKASSDNGGRIDPATLSDIELELLEQYLFCQETWQEVCLVIEKDDNVGTSSTVVINRPLSTKASVDLASMVMFGQWSDEAVSRSNEIVEFLDAFKEACAIYVGGPDCHGEPAMIIHGIADLEGAKEIAPGTAIYQGGLKAAIKGVNEGKYNPLDFRFFVGKYEYDENELDNRTEIGQYIPVACARSVALKQCIQLPKPLWHEVMELTGGEFKHISNLELMKRDDLKNEE